MSKPDIDIIEKLGFSRLIHFFDKRNLIGDERVILEQTKDLGIDSIYFCKNENHSYPALFFKKIVEFNDTNIKKIAEIQQKIWNYKKVLFLYVYTDTELRIYNCVKKPIVITKEINYKNEVKKFEIISATTSDKEKFTLLSSIFSAVAMDSGIIWTLEDAIKIRREINIQTRVDNFLVESLIRTAKKLIDLKLEIELVHKLLLRSLFLLYLEDRGATNDVFYAKINSKENSYFSILSDVGNTYKLYKTLKAHFNGGLFNISDGEEEIVKKEHLLLIKNCFTYGDDGTLQANLFPDWRIFKFNIIQIELLSEIYENFMAEMEAEKKHQTGTFYTPPSLVEFILNEKLPIKNNKQYNVKILDPTCGSGIFLVESFKRLIKRWEYANGKKLTDYETLKNLLLDNIFGIDINSNALKIAAFSLYLTLLENLDPKTLWQKVELPYLINDIDLPLNQQGKNLFRLNTIEKNDIVETIKFDLVVGNPPFGTKGLSPLISSYCKKYGFAQEQVLPFLHKATKFSPEGDIALIFNTKVLTNNSPSYLKFREWLFNSCYVDRIYNFSILRNAPENYGGKLFSSSSSPICIVFYRTNIPTNPSKKIIYYAPKTFIKSNVLDGVVIDDFDVSYLSREECQKPNTKIWKLAMWGGEGDINLINKLLSQKENNVKQFMKKHSIKSGVGFGIFNSKEEKTKPVISKELSKIQYLDANCITRYYTSERVLRNVKKSIKTRGAISYYKLLYDVQDISKIKKLDHFRRKGDLNAYKAPHIVIKKGLEKNKLCASFLDVDCSFKDGVYGFYSRDNKILKSLMAYINSKFSTYYIFMTNSSYGIEREQIMKEEYLSIPIKLNDEEIKEIADIMSTYLRKIKKNYMLENLEPPSEIISQIDKIIYKSLNLTSRDIAVINDTIDYTLDLFHNKEKSHALKPVKEIKPYVKMVCNEINTFLSNQKLYVNPTLYAININSPLLLIKLSFDRKKTKHINSNDNLDTELKKIDQCLWEQRGYNIYYRKKMNYYDGDDLYLIRPNQKRFWTQSAAISDASEIILECLHGEGNHRV